MLRRALVIAVIVAAGCGVPGARFPTDVQTSLARRDMRRMETDLLLVYYPEGRRPLAERMATQVEACAHVLKQKARLDNRHSREKMVLVVPDAPFNNAYVLPPVAGLEDVAVIPAGNTLDFATSFGLPPDPGRVGCHEVVHYVHVKQIAGLWGALRTVFGEMVTPQVGFDAWFLEGLATYYEARLQPGSGRPAWPVFTSMFHAGYAGGIVGGGDLSELNRESPFGHHYLVGAMFVQWLAETYGEPALWRVVELQARSTSVILSVNGRFRETYGKGLGDLMSEFRRWTATRFPVRARPPTQQILRTLGDDARWASGPAGEVAVIDEDIDQPARLRIWSADGRLVDNIALVDIIPPRRQVAAAPLLTSGMSFANDGTLWFTSIDLAGTFQTTRLFRWRGGRLDEVAHGLGPGGAISPDGRRYYHAQVDGDRWSLAVWENGTSKVLWPAPPGQYALRVQPSRDGTKLAASIWDGTRFAVWVLDATTGAKLSEHAGSAAAASPASAPPGATTDPYAGTSTAPAPATPASGPTFDGSFTDDGRLMLLTAVDGRFQVALVNADGTRTVITDAPYGSLEARARGGTIRFLARDGWRYTLDEVALPPPAPATAPTTDTETETETESESETESETETDSGSGSGAGSGSGSVPPSVGPGPPSSPIASSPHPLSPGAPSAAAPTATTATAPTSDASAPPPLRVLDDRPYSRFDSLFRPTLHTFAMIAPAVGTTQLGLALSGGDRLDLVRWAGAGYIDPKDTSKYSGAGGLILNDLAPFTLTAVGQRLHFTEEVRDADNMLIDTLDRETRDAILAITRTYRGTYSLSAGGTYSYDRTDDTTLRLYGPELGLGYAAVEGTRAVGPRRGLTLLATGAYFPRRSAPITDARAQLDLWIPLPVVRRLIIHVTARGHAVLDAPAPLIAVGGESALPPLWSSTPDDDVPDLGVGDGILPAQRRFAELLRGFEDFPLVAERVAIADVSWSYPLLVDAGVPTLGFLPGAFLRELELELFAGGAYIADNRHAAAGAALTVHLALFRVPLAIQYQLSRRLTDDRGVLHLVGFGPDL